jgi:hypothetical protein
MLTLLENATPTAKTRALCDICREPAIVFVQCEREYFRGFRCGQHGRVIIAEFQAKGLHVHLDGVAR